MEISGQKRVKKLEARRKLGDAGCGVMAAESPVVYRWLNRPSFISRWRGTLAILCKIDYYVRIPLAAGTR
jgi:hypothetical protein